MYRASRDMPDSKVHGANMGPTWGRQDPGGAHVGPMNIVIWDAIHLFSTEFYARMDNSMIQIWASMIRSDAHAPTSSGASFMYRDYQKKHRDKGMDE